MRAVSRNCSVMAGKSAPAGDVSALQVSIHIPPFAMYRRYKKKSSIVALFRPLERSSPNKSHEVHVSADKLIWSQPTTPADVYTAKVQILQNL